MRSIFNHGMISRFNHGMISIIRLSRHTAHNRLCALCFFGIRLTDIDAGFRGGLVCYLVVCLYCPAPHVSWAWSGWLEPLGAAQRLRRLSRTPGASQRSPRALLEAPRNDTNTNNNINTSTNTNTNTNTKLVWKCISRLPPQDDMSYEESGWDLRHWTY
jgi:hypothetical protein